MHDEAYFHFFFNEHDRAGAACGKFDSSRPHQFVSRDAKAPPMGRADRPKRGRTF